jgi:hypothetical protein
VANVQFLDLRDPRYGTDVTRGQAVAGVDGEPEARRLRCGTDEGLAGLRIVGAMSVPSGVEFDRMRAKVARSRDRVGVGIDEKAATDAGGAELLNGARQAFRIAGHVKSAFRGDFFAPLRDKGDLAGTQPLRQGDDRIAQGHFQVERRPDAGGQPLDIAVLNVTPVFAQVRRDAIGAGVLAGKGRRQWIRLVGPSCLTNRGHMIDVDEQTLVRGVHGSVRFRFWRTPPVDPPEGRHYVRIQTGLEPSVRKWALLVIVAAACSRNPSMGSSLTGAATARDAATMFLGAAQSQDLQAMGAVWGTDKGAARDNMDREQLDRRLILLQPCYVHDRAQVLDERLGTTPNDRAVRIQITRGTRTKTLEFDIVKGPSNRWYVLDVDYETVQNDFCRG